MLPGRSRRSPPPSSATGDIEGHDYNGIVTFSGAYNGHVIVSMPAQLLKELLLLQGETDLSEGNLLDAVGEIANTLGGNARKALGSACRSRCRCGCTARRASRPGCASTRT